MWIGLNQSKFDAATWQLEKSLDTEKSQLSVPSQVHQCKGSRELSYQKNLFFFSRFVFFPQEDNLYYLNKIIKNVLD